jgi:hypothetical protein
LVAHVSCGASWGYAPGTQRPWGTTNLYQPLPFAGFHAGDEVIRRGSPVIGILEHICYDERWHYAWVRWSNGRRNGRTFQVHRHHYIDAIEQATAAAIERAQRETEDQLRQHAERLGLVLPTITDV